MHKKHEFLTYKKIEVVWNRLLRNSGFPDSSAGKESPAMLETPVRFLGQEDSLEKG